MENAMITMKNINKGYMLGEERLPIQGHQFSGK